jgi:hypothetical protein
MALVPVRRNLPLDIPVEGSNTERSPQGVEAVMAKLVLSALLRSRRGGVQAEIAEFPDVKVTESSVGGALARLRSALWSRLRGVKVRTNCSGQPVSPLPKTPSRGDLTVPIEVEVATSPAGHD